MDIAQTARFRRAALLTDWTPATPGTVSPDYFVIEFQLLGRSEWQYFVVQITQTKHTTRRRGIELMSAILFFYCGSEQVEIPTIDFSRADAPPHWDGSRDTLTPEIVNFLSRAITPQEQAQLIVDYLNTHGFDHLLEAAEADQVRI